MLLLNLFDIIFFLNTCSFYHILASFRFKIFKVMVITADYNILYFVNVSHNKVFYLIGIYNLAYSVLLFACLIFWCRWLETFWAQGLRRGSQGTCYELKVASKLSPHVASVYPLLFLLKHIYTRS